MPRPRLSSATHRKNGSYKKDPQRENKLEPQPPVGRPVPPDTVKSDKIALKKWNETCDMLKSMKVLTKADRDLIELFSINYSQYVALLKGVRETGFSNGDKRNPLCTELTNVANRHIKLLSEFGLTPSSRSKLQIVDQADEDDAFNNWISGGGLN